MFFNRDGEPKVNQEHALETVIGGGNPAQADSHYEAALEQERNGFRIGAIEELRKAVANGTNPDHKFKLAYMLDLVGEESENVVIKLGSTSISINISGNLGFT